MAYMHHVQRVYFNECAAIILVVLHREGRVIPATNRNKNNEQPSRGQPEEAVQTSRNQTKLQHDTPSFKIQQSYAQLKPTPCQVNAHMSHVYMQCDAGSPP